MKKGIIFIHGIPIIPISKGLQKDFIYNIKKYLGKEYVNNCYFNLDFESIRPKLMNFNNNNTSLNRYES